MFREKSERIYVVFTLKTVLTSIQYLRFLTLQGKETNIRGHKLTQNKEKVKNKDPEKVQKLAKNIEQVPKNNKFRKTRSKLRQENPKKEVEPIAPTRKLSYKPNTLYMRTITSKN